MRRHFKGSAVTIAILLSTLRGAAPGAADEPANPSARARYPLALAAQPMSLPPHVVEIAIPRVGNFTGAGPAPTNFYVHLRWGLSDRIEIREVGIFATLVRGARGPSIGAGAALDPFGFYLNGGFAVTPDLFLEVAQRLGARVALRLRERAGASFTHLGGPVEVALHSALGADLYYDITDRSTFIAQLEYDYRQPVGGGDAIHVVAPGVGIALALATWLQLRALGGPVWARTPDAGAAPTAAWFALQLLVRL